jgi:hypothetical protein
MGSLTLRAPSIQGQTADQKIEALRRSVAAMVDELNLADWSAYRTLTDISSAIDAAKLDGSEGAQRTELADCAALRALIIKTADYAVTNSETFKLQLRSDYVAVGDFGTYWQNARMTVNGTSFGIEQLFDYSEGVNNKYTVNSQQYVKTGLLYYNGTTPVYGVGVGNIATTVQGKDTVLDKTQGELLTVTPGRIGFWQSGAEIAYLTNKKIYFPSATLTAYDAVLSGTLTAAAGSKIGPWNVESGCIWYGNSTLGAYGGLYFGTSGLSVGSRFVVDSQGNATLVGLSASSATISGSITATYLDVQNCTVRGSFSADCVGGGTLDFNTFNVSHFSADDITSGSISADIISAGTLDAGSIIFGYGDSGFDCPSRFTARMYYGKYTEVRVSDSGCAMTTSGGEIWAGTSSAGVTGLTWQGGSDRELKQNIVYGQDCERFFRSLRMAEFEFKRHPESKHYGFIAQDVQQALADCGMSERIVGKLLHHKENDGDTKEWDLALAYDEFIPLCVDEIQKVLKRLDALEARGG